MRNKTLSILCVILGTLLLGAAVVFFTVRQAEKKRSAADLPLMVNALEAALPERTAGVIEQRTDSTMPAVEIGGLDFIGLLELPGRGIRLPVAAQWSSSDLGFRPARYAGSVYDGTLIIGGSSEADNFGFADQLDAGEEIAFTDMTGSVFRYTVRKVSHADSAETDTLADPDDALTLFVKKDGRFLIVRCGAV